MNINELQSLISQGENQSLEFKLTLGELMRMFQQSGMFHFDQVAVPKTSINDLNMAALDKYFVPYELEFSRETEAVRKQLLINTDILAISGETTVGSVAY